ncbi:MAG TPA: tripartite tricarboxylate transporter substrate binding protein [Ramlibacter sp.]|nr:tripartite tricarboxylate transporter substrate binding protein [Ramlibacter sp.]
MRRTFLALLAALAMAPALAQWQPTKPIRMIVPLAAGGGTDLAARVVAAELSTALGQQVTIDNRLGANGVVGVDAASKSPADGYTILVGSSTTLAANKFLYKTAAQLEPFKEFVPLSMLGTIDFALMVPADSPYKNLGDLLGAARKEPGKLSYGFGSSAALLCGEMLKTTANIDIVKIGYKGSPQSLTDLAAGRLQLVCDPLGTSMPLIKAGKLRPIASTGKQRNALMPELPLMAEAGLPMEHETWAGFFAPAGLPREVHQRLASELVKIQSRPDVQAKIRETGFVPRPLGPEEFGTVHRADYARMERLIKGAGISPE